LNVTQVTQKLRGTPGTKVKMVRKSVAVLDSSFLYSVALQVLDRGERYPIVFSHVQPDAAFKAPSDARYHQVLQC
jgi:hypothetical protein